MSIKFDATRTGFGAMPETITGHNLETTVFILPFVESNRRKILHPKLIITRCLTGIANFSEIILSENFCSCNRSLGIVIILYYNFNKSYSSCPTTWADRFSSYTY